MNYDIVFDGEKYTTWLLEPKAKQLTDEEINDIYDEWQALSGDPVKLYELFKLKAQEK